MIYIMFDVEGVIVTEPNLSAHGWDADFDTEMLARLVELAAATGGELVTLSVDWAEGLGLREFYKKFQLKGFPAELWSKDNWIICPRHFKNTVVCPNFGRIKSFNEFMESRIDDEFIFVSYTIRNARDHLSSEDVVATSKTFVQTDLYYGYTKRLFDATLEHLLKRKSEGNAGGHTDEARMALRMEPERPKVPAYKPLGMTM